MRTIIAATALATLLSVPALAEPGAEHWIAVSNTAMGITGDIVLSPKRLTMAGKTLPLQVAADVPDFGTDDGTVAARILRVTEPSDPVLLHGNRLCRAQWIVVWHEHKFGQTNLEMDVFSSDARPSGENSPGLCGTYMYSKP